MQELWYTQANASEAIDFFGCVGICILCNLRGRAAKKMDFLLVINLENYLEFVPPNPKNEKFLPKAVPKEQKSPKSQNTPGRFRNFGMHPAPPSPPPHTHVPTLMLAPRSSFIKNPRKIILGLEL